MTAPLNSAPIEWAEWLRGNPARRCVAHKKRNGEQCRNWAIRGGTVCRYHGGSAPNVKRAAAQRLDQTRNEYMVRQLVRRTVHGADLYIPDDKREDAYATGSTKASRAATERTTSAPALEPPVAPPDLAVAAPEPTPPPDDPEPPSAPATPTLATAEAATAAIAAANRRARVSQRRRTRR